jgi:hypothetical protein
MQYVYCLFDKTETSRLTENTHKVDTVLPSQFDTSMYKYTYTIDADVNSSTHGVANYWVFDFSSEPFRVRLKSDLDRLPDAKETKRNEIKQLWIASTTKDSPLCYVTTTVIDSDHNPIVMDSSEKDQNNIRTLLEDMEDNNTTETIIKDYHNNYHRVTVEQVREIKRCINRRGCELFDSKERLYSQIAAATTTAEIERIKWPVTERHK